MKSTMEQNLPQRRRNVNMENIPGNRNLQLKYTNNLFS